MKKITSLLAVCLLATLAAKATDSDSPKAATTTTTTTTAATTTTEADQKWAQAVDKKIAAGPTTVSTPSETRAKIAAKIATKYGRTSKLAKTETGYQVVIEGGSTSLVAKASND